MRLAPFAAFAAFAAVDLHRQVAVLLPKHVTDPHMQRLSASEAGRREEGNKGMTNERDRSLCRRSEGRPGLGDGFPHAARQRHRRRQVAPVEEEAQRGPCGLQRVGEWPASRWAVRYHCPVRRRGHPPSRGCAGPQCDAPRRTKLRKRSAIA